MSPMIDPSEQTGKSRAQRIRLDYFRQRHWLGTWRWVATACAVLIVAAYLAWVALAPGGPVHLSTGEISMAHASFDQTCSQCHIDFVPIAVDAWRLEPEIAIGKTAAKCRHCHADVHSHSDALNAAGTQLDQQCSLCHTEHRGRNHQLIPASNQTCVQCHQDTARFCAAPSLEGQDATANVTQFSLQEHGDFRSLTPAEAMHSRIEFDHALHMQPGQVTPGRRGAMRLGRIAAEHRHRYERPGDSDDALVQLQCADCHQFQAASAGRVRSGDFDWGRGSLPVRYDQHCIACHPLTLPGQREDQLGIPHGKSPQALQDSIRGHLAALDSETGAAMFSLQDDGPPIRIPGQQVAGRADRASLSHGTSGATVTGDALPQLQLQRIIGRVQQQCQLCHTDPDLNAVVTLPRLPQPRLRAGRFDHGAHRTMTCIACHPGADPAGQSVSPEVQSALARWLQRISGKAPPLPPSELTGGGEDPPQRLAADASHSGEAHRSDMIVGIAACTACHQSTASIELAGEGVLAADEADAAVFGGLSVRASVRCTSCHQYHGEDVPSPPQVGSPARMLEAAGLPTSRPIGVAAQPHRLISTPILAPKPAHRGLANTNFAAVVSPASASVNLAAQRHADAAVDAPSGRWIGSDSCATSTCHGGSIRQTVDWNSSQSVFEAYDPHANAALVLAEPQSRQIVELLDPAAAGSPERFRQVMRMRCNGCHLPSHADGVTRQRDAATSPAAAQVVVSVEDPPLQASELLEGVSCESCHGPASGWVQGHLSEDWTIRSEMRDNRDYVARLDGCVRCHVGSRREDGVVRDVNHDLIAAGHPALRFEPWSALRRLPRHGAWQRAADGLPTIDGEADLRRFLVGRVVTLRAAIRLTVERLNDAITPPREAVWPELADYDCFACHHSLKITNLATRPRPGFPTPHPWLHSGLVADGLRQIAAEDAAALVAALETLRLRSAGGNEIVPAAREVEAILDRYLDRLSDPRALPEAVVAWRSFEELHSLSSESDRQGMLTAGGGWYDAAYWYLRSHVSLRDSGWLQNSARAKDHRAVAAELQQLADALQFGRTDRDDPIHVDSPEHFELSVYRRLAERLTDLVESN